MKNFLFSVWQHMCWPLMKPALAVCLTAFLTALAGVVNTFA